MDNKTLAVKLLVTVMQSLTADEPIEVTVGEVEMILDAERPDKAAKIKSEIANIKEMLKNERRPESIKRHENSISLKEKELIRLRG